MGRQAVEHGCHVPSRAELEGGDGPGGWLGERVEEPVEPSEVRFQMGQGQQHGAQGIAERGDGGQEGGHPVLDPVEVTAMGDAHVGLGDELEARWRLVPPALEGGGRR